MKIYLTLALGILLFASCTSEPSGSNPSTANPNLDDIEKEIVKGKEPVVDSIKDTVEIVPPPSPMVLPPMPEPPPPWPGPWPDPEPIVVPEPNDPMPEPPMMVIEPVEDEIMNFPDVEAQFPGGDEAMYKFIRDNIKYPTIDKETGQQGKVYISFVVEIDGAITDIKVLRGVSESIDREAKRVIRIMPKWSPAEVREKKVRSLMRLPIAFVFQD